jgi:amino acid transporter
MSVELASQPVRNDKGLKKGAIGTVSTTVIAVSSTAPAYSMAATIGLIAAVVGVHSPAIILVAFIPMLFTAAAYYYLNRVDPDCGATFSWVSRAMGPNAGWLGGWGIIIADILVMPSLAWTASYYTYSLFGNDDPGAYAIMWLGIGFILLMTVVAWLGIELSARTQFLLLAAEIIGLVGFSIVALVDVWANHPAGSITPSLSWLNPFELTLSEISQGVLLAIFIYWGWDTAANVNEETRNGRFASGFSTVISTVILMGTYLVVTFATTAYKGPEFLSDNPDDVLTVMAPNRFWEKVLIIAILTSAAACTQTTILPTARTTLSMAAHRALPKSLGKISPKYFTPTWSTWWFGIASIVWYIVLVAIDREENILWDSISGLTFAVAFYYGLTALASPILFRRVLGKSLRSFVFVGLVPLIGAGVLFWVLVKSAFDLFDPVGSYTPAWFAFGDFSGVGAAFVIGVGSLLLGIPLWLWARKAYPTFFARKPEAVESLTDLLPDELRVTEETTEVPELETVPFEPPPVRRAGTPTEHRREE